jgi:hypothetical protein
MRSSRRTPSRGSEIFRPFLQTHELKSCGIVWTKPNCRDLKNCNDSRCDCTALSIKGSRNFLSVFRWLDDDFAVMMGFLHGFAFLQVTGN